MEKSNSDTIYLPLENVESEHCALIVDKGLSKLAGISKHSVELNNHRAVIEGKDIVELISKAVHEIRDLGYDVTTVKKTYPVLNMTCASCANSTQGVLEMQKGVVSASVNYANAQATIEFIPSITDANTLKTSLQAVGYDLMIDESEEAKDSLEEVQLTHYKNLQKRTLGAVLISLPIVLIAMLPALMHVDSCHASCILVWKAVFYWRL
jgi:P-type Cu2+ transporter